MDMLLCRIRLQGGTLDGKEGFLRADNGIAPKDIRIGGVCGAHYCLWKSFLKYDEIVVPNSSTRIVRIEDVYLIYRSVDE